MPRARGKRSARGQRKSPAGQSTVVPVDPASTDAGTQSVPQSPSRLSIDVCIDLPSIGNSSAARPPKRRLGGSRTRRQSQTGRSVDTPVTPLSDADPLTALQSSFILIDPPSSGRGSLSLQRRGRRSSRGERNQSTPSSRVILVDPVSNATSLPTPQSSQRGGRQRSRRIRNQSRQTNVNDTDPSFSTNSLSTSQPSQRRPRRNTRRQARPTVIGPRRNTRRQARPTVISLDVTYSSDELVEELPCTPEKPADNILNFSLSPCSDEAEISDTNIRSPTPPPSPTPPLSPINVEEKGEDTEENKDLHSDYSSDYEEEEDILFIDYSAKRDAAFKKAFKEIKAMEKEERKKMDNSCDIVSLDCITVLDEKKSPEKKSKDMNFSILDSPIDEPNVKKRKKTKKMKKALESLKQFSEELSKMKADGSFNGDITILSDDEDDGENKTITLFIKFQADYMRCKVRQFQKFSSVYEDIADRLGLNAAQILLCHDDKVISQETCPSDLKLSYGDIIECGIQSRSAVQTKETITKQSPGTIPLKVQNSDRKETVTIYIGLSGKMKELMHRYAEEKNIPIEELHFSFDGEILSPNDTPKSLDLEGNECIDVYRKCF